MKRCPNCNKNGVMYNPHYFHEKCLACGWLNVDDIDVDKVKHPIRFWKFINAIKEKMKL